VQHIFFAPDDDETEWPATGAIYVRRKNAAGQWEKHPHAFAPDELPDFESVTQRWGGGTYEFIGRSEDNAQVAARAIHTLAGRPKPLIDDGGHTESAAPGAPAPVAPTMPDGIPQWMGILMQTQQQSAAQMQAVILGITSALGSIGAAIAGRPAPPPVPSDGSAASLVSILAKQSAEDRKMTLDLLQKLADQRQQGGGGGFAQGFDFANMINQATAGDPIDTMLGAFGQRIVERATADPPPNGAPRS